MIRITGGRLRGQIIQSINIPELRPTLDKTRAAVFDVLASRISLNEYHAVDLFAGTGALGIEAISRGAIETIFIDQNKKLIQKLKQNLTRLKIDKNSQVHCQTCLSWLKRQSILSSPSIFFIDPPYHSNLIQETLDHLEHQFEALIHTILVIEMFNSTPLNIPKSLTIFQEKQYGDTNILFLSNKEGV